MRKQAFLLAIAALTLAALLLAQRGAHACPSCSPGDCRLDYFTPAGNMASYTCPVVRDDTGRGKQAKCSFDVDSGEWGPWSPPTNTTYVILRRDAYLRFSTEVYDFQRFRVVVDRDFYWEIQVNSYTPWTGSLTGRAVLRVGESGWERNVFHSFTPQDFTLRGRMWTSSVLKYTVYYGEAAANPNLDFYAEACGPCEQPPPSPPSPPSKKRKWRLIVLSDPPGMPFKLSGENYTAPWEKEYVWEEGGDWSLSYEALGNGIWAPYRVEVRVLTSPWVTSCCKTWSQWNFTPAPLRMNVKAWVASYKERPAYRVTAEGSRACRRSGYCGLKIVVIANYSKNPASLAVRTNLDGLPGLPSVVAVNGSWVETPYLVSMPEGFTVELKANSSFGYRREWPPEAWGLPDNLSVRCPPAYKYREKAKRSAKPLNDTYIVEFDAEVSNGKVAVYRCWKVSKYKYECELLWSFGGKHEHGSTRARFRAELDGYYLKLRVKAWRVGHARLRNLVLARESTYGFRKWVVYDEQRNAVLDPPSNITVTVPPGANWTAIAYYNYTPTLLGVDSVPTGVTVAYSGDPGNGSAATPFTLSGTGNLIVTLKAPATWMGLEFRNWTLYDSQDQALWSSASPSVSVTVPSGGFYRAIAYYSEESTSYETIRLQGSVYHLPYQWVSLPMNLTPGLWILNSSPAEPNPSTRTLIYATLQAPSGDYMLVPAVNLLVNVTETERLPVLRCSSGECRPILSIECLNYSGYYLVGLGVMNWTRPGSSAAELSSLLLPNGTTLAIYNVTLLNASGGTVYWKPVIVTSLNVELDAIYEEKGVNLVWNVSYSHLAPDWLHATLNVTEALKPYQSLYLKLYWEGEVIWKQRLGVVPEGLSLPESSRFSYAGVYVSHDELVNLFGFESPVLTARATWTAVGVPLAENASVRFVPAGIELRSLTQRLGAWVWEVAPTTIVGNVPGNYLSYGGVLVYYFNGTRHTLSPVPGAGFDLYRFSTPPFKAGQGTLAAHYIPPTTKNTVYFFYPFEF